MNAELRGRMIAQDRLLDLGNGTIVPARQATEEHWARYFECHDTHGRKLRGWDHSADAYRSGP